jgi:hypothetical protein
MLLIILNVYKIMADPGRDLLYSLLRYANIIFGESRVLTNETAV